MKSILITNKLTTVYHGMLAYCYYFSTRESPTASERLSLSRSELFVSPEFPPGCGGCEGHSQLQQLGKGFGKVLEKGLLVQGIEVDPLSKFGVPDQDHVTGEHHELARGVFKLIGSRPRPPVVRSLWTPAFLHQETKVFVL